MPKRCVGGNLLVGGNLFKEEPILPTSFATRLLRLSVAALLCSFLPAQAEPVTVRHIEGTLHGFLSARGEDGRIIAVGDLSQVIQGDRVVSHLVFHFKDGSLDDETTVYTQHKTFQLISDRHTQRGPFFPRPLDTSIDVRSGEVTVRTTGKDGKEEVDTEHLDLPPDLANGLTFTITKNMPPDGSPMTVSMVLAAPRPRLVKLVYTACGEEPFSVAGVARKAMHIDMKIDIGGVAGVIAPLIGKQPPDFHIWVLGGPAPTFVKEVGYLYRDGPILTFELASPVWPQPPEAAEKLRSR